MELNKMLAIVAIGCGLGAHAQTSEAYWVVEGNINKPDYTIVHFYDAQHQLIKEERIEGRFLDIRRKRNVALLNRRLSHLTEQHKESLARYERSDSIK